MRVMELRCSIGKQIRHQAMEGLRGTPKGADDGWETLSEKFVVKISTGERSYQKTANGAQCDGDIKNV
jgi:hypothetical protein